MHIEIMTPEGIKDGGEKLVINYSFASTKFGKIILASTTKGLCYLAFADNTKKSVALLKDNFPHATFKNKSTAIQKKALGVFSDKKNLAHVPLHLQGTPFQLKVWTALLTIPTGQLVTYGHVAKQIGKDRAFRAVGTAVGKNPVAFLIPCHRVIQSSGALGNYHWGVVRKAALIDSESARMK